MHEPTIVEIEAAHLVSWDEFHSTFKRSFGFLNGYGSNMDAWIDCMSYLDDPDSGMTQVCVPSGETLTILIKDYPVIKSKAPEQWLALVECTGFVNHRMSEVGKAPLLALSFDS